VEQIGVNRIEAAEVRQLARKFLEKVTSVRHHLHKHPELSFKEFETSAYIQSQLKEAGIEFKSGYVKTGIVAVIRGKNPGKKTILLRADMDALPIEEQNEVPYKSQNKGVMHACGHDVHSSCVLGASLILNNLREKFEGTVKVMFQPGEEVLPGGASLMIKEGVLEDPKVEKALAMHVFPGMEAGRVGFRGGMYMASTDELYITVKGKGGHAAMPADYNNPLLIASEILLAINNAFMKPGSLQGTPGESIPTVVAFGRIEGKGLTNVIPDEVKLDGTFRTMNEEWRKKVHASLREIVTSVAEKHNGTAELRIDLGYPVLLNDEAFTASCSTAAKELLGNENVDELPLRMTAEDFAYITQRVPSCFFRLGVSNKQKGIVSGVHTPTFDIDESALETGTSLMAWLAIRELTAKVES
jgi:amidohydrolase